MFLIHLTYHFEKVLCLNYENQYTENLKNNLLWSHVLISHIIPLKLMFQLIYASLSVKMNGGIISFS